MIRSAQPDAGAAGRRGFAATRLHRDGEGALRVLLVADAGTAPMLGEDAASRFADDVTDRLWLRLRRGLDVDLLHDTRAVLHAIAGSFTASPRTPYDLVAFVIDPPELLGSRERRGLIAILQSALMQVVTTTRVALIVLDREDGSSRHRVLELGRELTDAARSSTVRLSVMQVRQGRGGSADAVAQHLQLAFTDTAPLLDDATGASSLDRRLEHIVQLVRSAFDTDVAAVNLAERGTLTTIACDGAETGDQPLSGSLCDLTIGGEGLVVVADTFAVPALWSHRAVLAPRPIRFYAGFPISAPGRPGFGALCVYDRPRAGAATSTSRCCATWRCSRRAS